MSVRVLLSGLSALSKYHTLRTGRRRNTRRLLSLECMEQRRLLTTIDLAVLTASEGMVAYGAAQTDHSGLSVSGAGDFNGDGFDDILIGARLANSGGSDRGAAYLIFGGPAMPASLDLNALGSSGVVFTGLTNNDFIGRSVSAAGDLNGDGFDDLIVGADGGDGSTDSTVSVGETYVIFGSASLSGTISVASASVTIYGVGAGDGSGRSVSGAGDVNGDGYDDLIIGANLADAAGNAKNNAGESYIVFGGASMPATIELATLGTAGVTIYGSGANDQSGLSVSGAGDVNGDGYADVIIGTGNASTGAPLSPARTTNGESYVVFGGPSLPATIDLAVPAATFITIIGAQNGDLAGYTVGGGGDVNGDGFDDVVINAPGGDGPPGLARGSSGDSYVIFGSASLPATIDLLTLGTAGVTIAGADISDAGIDVNTGGSISIAGDVNGDGYDDLIIGKERADAAGNAKSLAGESIVIFGGPSLPSTIDLATPGSAGITIFGSGAGDNNGVSVSSAGDVNGDGFADLLTGAFLADGLNNLKSASGESYLIYGGNGFTSSVTHLGTSAAETLTGTTGADIMAGGRGNDVLLGNGGADVLNGGEGDDVLAVADLAFARIVGGNGFDTLRLDGSGLTLDLTTLADNRIQGIEQIDITGSGLNTLTLNYREVLNISDESNELIVRRNGGDVVNIGSGWTQGADQQIGSDNFQTYTQGIARLLIEDTTPVGTAGNDAFVLTYLSTSTSGSLTITRSTDGGQVEDLGLFPMNVPLVLDGLGGTDSVQILGTNGHDTFIVNSLGMLINGASLTLIDVEARTLVGRAGNDVYQFDTNQSLGLFSLDESLGGVDTIDLSSSTLAVALNLALATTQVVNANLSLNLGSATRFENAIGGLGNDTLTGNVLNNTLTGGGGNDTLNGGRGNDILIGGEGDDTYLFTIASTPESDQVIELPGQGTDRLSFASISTPVVLNLGTTGLQAVHTNRSLMLNDAASFENATGGSSHDVLTGNALANNLVGGSGNDTLNGAAGNDTLQGGLGNDIYVFDPATTSEADSIVELPNQGTDTLDFSSLTTAVVLNLGSTATQNVHSLRTLQLNSATTLENVVGGSGNDTLTGNVVNNTLTGGGGNDTLNGGRGNDILIGGEGDDTYLFTIASTPESDQVIELPGQGTDHLNFAAISTPVFLNLGTTGLQTGFALHANRNVLLNDAASFENATGGSSDDVLIGNALDNNLVGGPGNDTLNGGSGNDVLEGGQGNDIYVFDPATTSEADSIVELPNQGTDTLDFSSLTTAVTLNLGSTAIQTVHTLRTIQLNSRNTLENANGGLGDDILLGNTLNNVLLGGDGNDILVGNAGDDILEGMAGNDILIGGLGLDVLQGRAGDDILIAGRTTSDNSVSRLADMRSEWTSLNAYETRIANLRSGVGASNVSLKAMINVLNDAGEADILIGGIDNDWFFAASDDILVDLFSETVDWLDLAIS